MSTKERYYWSQRGQDIFCCRGAPGACSALTSAAGNEVLIANYECGGRPYVEIFSYQTLQSSYDSSIDASDQLGFSLSASDDGQVFALGSPKGDIGYVRIFHKKYPGKEITITPGRLANARFGHSVSISGDGQMIAIGAPDADPWDYTSRILTNAGQVRVYKLHFTDNSMGHSEVWSVNGKDANTAFGTSVAFSSNGSRLAVGGPKNTVNGKVEAGLVVVYKLNALGTYSLLKEFKGGPAYDNFGASVALSCDGSTLAVGGPYNDAVGLNGLVDSGLVRVYKFDGADYSQQREFKGIRENGNFGSSVALSCDGSTLVVGERYHISVYKGLATLDLATLLVYGSHNQFSLSKDGSVLTVAGEEGRGGTRIVKVIDIMFGTPPNPTPVPTTAPTATRTTHGAILDTWTALNSGKTILDLMTSTNYLENSPNKSILLLDSLKGPTNVDDNYGSRMRGWLVPPVTGDYLFWLTSDGDGQFWLSTNEADANLILRCLNGVVGGASAQLVAGQAYYYEVRLLKTNRIICFVILFQRYNASPIRL
jgi:WD40 repeat protein